MGYTEGIREFTPILHVGAVAVAPGSSNRPTKK